MTEFLETIGLITIVALFIGMIFLVGYGIGNQYAKPEPDIIANHFCVDINKSYNYNTIYISPTNYVKLKCCEDIGTYRLTKLRCDIYTILNINTTVEYKRD